MTFSGFFSLALGLYPPPLFASRGGCSSGYLVSYPCYNAGETIRSQELIPSTSPSHGRKKLRYTFRPAWNERIFSPPLSTNLLIPPLPNRYVFASLASLYIYIRGVWRPFCPFSIHGTAHYIPALFSCCILLCLPFSLSSFNIFVSWVSAGYVKLDFPHYFSFRLGFFSSFHFSFGSGVVWGLRIMHRYHR